MELLCCGREGLKTKEADMAGRSNVLFGRVFKRLSYGDQAQLVRRALDEMGGVPGTEERLGQRRGGH